MPRIKEVMIPSLAVLARDTSTTEAAQRMKALSMDAIPVCDGREFIGMVTASDLVLRVMALHRNPDEARVGEIMSQSPLFCYEDDDIKIVWGIMSKMSVGCLPVVSKEKQIIGMVRQLPLHQRYVQEKSAVQPEPHTENPWAIRW